MVSQVLLVGMTSLAPWTTSLWRDTRRFMYTHRILICGRVEFLSVRCRVRWWDPLLHASSLLNLATPDEGTGKPTYSSSPLNLLFDAMLWFSFWYELGGHPHSFTLEQLAEIRKARLARIVCDNTDLIDTIQLYPMVLPDHEMYVISVFN